MATYTVEFAQATDRLLAKLHEQAERVSIEMDRAIESIHSYVGDQREMWKGIRQGPWGKTLLDCLALPAAQYYYADSLAKAHETLLDCRTKLVPLDDAIAEQEAIYNQHHWPRFFLCISSDGHIHSHRGCSTCTWKTRFGWLPDLSGLDEAAAVAAHGARLCTICYPSAPVEYTNYFDTEKAAKKANQCPGSGKLMRRESRNHCPDCGKYGRPTRNGYVKAHQRASAS